MLIFFQALTFLYFIDIYLSCFIFLGIGIFNTENVSIVQYLFTLFFTWILKFKIPKVDSQELMNFRENCINYLDFSKIYKWSIFIYFVFCKINYFTRKNWTCTSLWQIHWCFADTKDQWARDDPAFLVLLSFWLVGKKFRMFKPFYTRITLTRIFFLIIHCIYVQIHFLFL